MERALSSLGLKSVRSTKDISNMQSKVFPTTASDYELLEDCGRGVSATVHRALCKPLNEFVAIKKMNLESMNCNLEEIIHEAQLMKKYHHPNILPLHCSFVHGEDLWMVMPFIAGGSVLHIMKYAHPEGLEEPVIATIMREVLKGLEYVHKHGGIHRDVKAGNILVDTDGMVKLADFGVAATIERGSSWGTDNRARMTFVGTPCWMAPEVMEQTMGYDHLADIWSVGITLLELAHGHAPFAKFPPMKILMMTLSNPPPTLDDKGGKKHFSKQMRDVVTKCLQKDPSKRPSATQLLEHRFFKQGRDAAYLKEHMMAAMTSPLTERVERIRMGKAATTPEENDRAMEASQEQYVRGVSSWNFDMSALKQAAANEPDTPSTRPSLLATIPSDSSISNMLSPPPTPSIPNSASADSLTTAPTIQSANGQPLQQAMLAQQAGSAPPGDLPWSSNSSASTALSAFAVPAAAEAATAAAAGLPPPRTQIVTGELRSSLSDSIASGSGRRTQDSLPESVGGPLSPPGMSSPLTISREPSLPGSAPAPIPKQDPSHKQKKGRFQVYEDGEQPPPFSPAGSSFMMDHAPHAPHALHTAPSPSTSSASAAAAGLSNTFSAQRSEHRISEDGSKSVDGAADRGAEGGASSSSKAVDPAVQVEKKKGRFRVIEEDGPRRIASTASLSDASKRADAAARANAHTAGALGPWRAYLQDLLDQSAAHTTGLCRLLSAAAEAEHTGKPPSFLTRASPHGRPPLVDGPNVVEQLEQLHLRLAEADRRAAALEDANGKLRARAEQLEEAGRELRARAEAAEEANRRLVARGEELAGGRAGAGREGGEGVEARGEGGLQEAGGDAGEALQRSGSGSSISSAVSSQSDGKKAAIIKVLRRLSSGGPSGLEATVPAMHPMGTYGQ